MDPSLTARKIQEAEAALRDLNLPPGERNALVLLALLDLSPGTPWAEASAPRVGITAILTFINKKYGRTYAPNTRESIRKLSVQVFRDAGLVNETDDLAKTSAKYAYSLKPAALELLRNVGSPRWPAALLDFLAQPADDLTMLQRSLTTPPEQIQLTALRLCNFRSLVDTDQIPLRPLLLLVGRNSSGKSSLLRFFPLLRQTARRRSASPLAWYTPGGDVDFGNFSTVLCKASPPQSEVQIGLSFDLARGPAVPPLQVQAQIQLSGDASQTFLRSCQLTAPGHHALLRFDDEGVLTTFTADGEDALEGYAARREPGALLPRLIDASERVPTSAPDFAKLVPSLLSTLNGWLEHFVTRVHYSGPVRETPQRLYRSEEAMVSQIDSTGGNLAMFLRSLTQAEREDFAAWVQERFGFRVGIEPEGPLSVAIHIEESGQRFNLIDMGYGFSQVLPILAQSWASLRGAAPGPHGQPPSLLVLEQPELHLHPYHQEKLADVFAGLVNQATRPLSAIVETHSETMINRFGELIANGELPRDRVLVLLFEKDPRTGVTQLRRSEYDERGFLQHWPVGFFAP